MLAAAVEQSSEHPIGTALRDAAGKTSAFAVSEVRNVPGSGMSARVDGRDRC